MKDHPFHLAGAFRRRKEECLWGGVIAFEWWGERACLPRWEMAEAGCVLWGYF